MNNKSRVQKALETIINALYKAKKEKELHDLLDDLLTEEETLDLAQRINVAQAILQGKTYETISKELDVSTATISKIAQVLKYGKDGLKNIAVS